MAKSYLSRRQFLRTLAVGAGAGLLIPVLEACARAFSPAAAPSPSSAPASATGTAAVPSLPGVGAGKGAPPPAVTTPGQIAITSNADFYTVAFRSESPAVPSDWKLTFDGNVDKSLVLTLDDIKAMPPVQEMRTLECISNPAGGPLISNANWKGIRMKDLLDRVGVKTGTTELKLESFDGYSTAIPLALAQDEHALLVYEMNGEPLPIEHGKPLRCLWPGHYGMKQPKWLTHISAISVSYQGFWEQQGWSDDASIKPNSRIDKPEDDSTVTAQTLVMQGIGFSGAAGIAKIEVSQDGNTWQEAKLTRGPTPYVWTQWNWQGPMPPNGQYTLFARVTDNKGNIQTKQGFKLLGDTFPGGTADVQPVVVTLQKG